MSSKSLALGLALSSRDWRPSLHRHCRDHEASVAVTLLRDSRDAFDASIDVVVVDDDTSWLSAPFVTKSRESGIGLIGIFDPLEADGYGLEFLRRLGIDMVAPVGVSTDELLALAQSARPDRSVDERFAELRFGDLVGQGFDAIGGERLAETSRQVLAVGGPAGSGVTEVAVGLTELLGHDQQRRPILIDVDETHPSLARRLGLGIHPHIITASERLRGEQPTIADFDFEDQLSSAVMQCLAKPAIGQAALPFDTIVGLASRDDWSLLRPDDALDLIDELAARWPVVITRLGPQLEDLSRFVDRFGISRTVAGRADHVIGVCEATSTGVLRFVDWLVDALGVIGDTPLDLVLNKCPRSGQVTGQIVEQLRSIVGDRIDTIVEVPQDRRVERAAWDATMVGRSPFTKALAPMVDKFSMAVA